MINIIEFAFSDKTNYCEFNYYNNSKNKVTLVSANMSDIYELHSCYSENLLIINVAGKLLKIDTKNIKKYKIQKAYMTKGGFICDILRILFAPVFSGILIT